MGMAICPNCFAEKPDTAGTCTYCGYMPVSAGEASITLAAGAVLKNRYLVGRTLGMGGFGVTYLAKDLQSGKICAVKEYLPVQIAVRDHYSDNIIPSNPNDREIYLSGLDMFAREVAMLSAFSGNNSIVQVWDYFKENDTAYSVMEYLDGVNLKRLARSMGGRLPLEHANEMLYSIGQALECVHANGMLHRDVSPENIMVTRDGRFKLIDFGATRYFVGDKSKSLSIVLKPGFAPPEQYSSKGNQGPWTDIYALAATYYLVVGSVQVPEATDRLSGVQYPPLHTIELSFPQAASKPLEKALEINYKNRLQDVGTFMSQMRAALNAPAVQAAHARPYVQEKKQGPPVPDKNTGRRPKDSSGSKLFAPKNPVSGTPPQINRVPAPPVRSIGISGVTPCLREVRGGNVSNKWLLPSNMDILVGNTPACHIQVGAAGLNGIFVKLRFDDKKAIFYLWSDMQNAVFLADGSAVLPNQAYKFDMSAGFYILSNETIFQLGVE